ncbi:MAG: Ada metal-binding domain-containing protein [Methanotrichaceae archaeon]
MEKNSITHLDVDFVPEVSEDLFRIEGDIVLWSNASLPYLMIDAVLQNGNRKIDDIKYMIMDVEPSKDQHFELSENRKISQGIYNCTLEISGPEGLIESQTRRCLSEFEGSNKGREVQYIFVSQGEKEPRIISDNALKNYLSDQAPSNNLTQAQGSISSPKRSLSEILNSSNSMAERLVGSKTSKKYHLPDCSYAIKIKQENKIYFANAEEAQKQGYQPCKACNP